MFKANFSENNKFRGAQRDLGRMTSDASPCLRAWAEPSPESLPLGGFMFMQGARHSENLY